MSHSEINTSLSAQYLSFLSPDFESTATKNFMFIGVTLRSNVKSADRFRLNLTTQYAPQNSILSYLNLREIYYTFKFHDQFSDQSDEKTTSRSVLYVGRKLLNWSSLDTIWNLGVYQPQFKWSPISPENQGLMGLFWNQNTESSFGFGYTLFASPLFIPDQGASYELKEGQFLPSNPWFAAPPQNIKFQNQILPIDYEITKPDVKSVVFQTQYGAQARFGKAKGYFVNLAGMYKPANQLAFGYKGVLVTTRVRIDITPKTYFENIYSADMGYRQDWGVAQLSLLYSKPQNPTFDSSFNAPDFEQSVSWGPQFLYKCKPFEFFIGYLDTSGGRITDVGPDASADRVSLSQRFLFKQALQTQVKYSDIFWNQVRLNSSFQFMTSAKEGFRQIRFKNNFKKLNSSWAFWLDFHLIDTNSSITTNIEPYKSSDQLWLGASYDL